MITIVYMKMVSLEQSRQVLHKNYEHRVYQVILVLI